jgi:hypothetical protein
VAHANDKNRIKRFSLNLNMDTIRIDILNPKAMKLLENLEALNLISIKKDSKKRFKEIVKQLRTKSTSTPSLEEITKEVESVRAKRHGN